MNTFKNIAMLLALSFVAVFSTGCDQASNAAATVGGWVGLSDDTDPVLAEKMNAYNDAAETMVDSLEEANDKLAEIQEMAAEAEELQKQYAELSTQVDNAVAEAEKAMISLEEYVPTMSEELTEAQTRIRTAFESVTASTQNIDEKINAMATRTQETIETVETVQVQVKAAEGTVVESAN